MRVEQNARLRETSGFFRPFLTKVVPGSAIPNGHIPGSDMAQKTNSGPSQYTKTVFEAIFDTSPAADAFPGLYFQVCMQPHSRLGHALAFQWHHLLSVEWDIEKRLCNVRGSKSSNLRRDRSSSPLSDPEIRWVSNGVTALFITRTSKKHYCHVSDSTTSDLTR